MHLTCAAARALSCQRLCKPKQWAGHETKRSQSGQGVCGCAGAGNKNTDGRVEPAEGQRSGGAPTARRREGRWGGQQSQKQGMSGTAASGSKAKRGATLSSEQARKGAVDVPYLVRPAMTAGGRCLFAHVKTWAGSCMARLRRRPASVPWPLAMGRWSTGMLVGALR